MQDLEERYSGLGAMNLHLVGRPGGFPLMSTQKEHERETAQRTGNIQPLRGHGDIGYLADSSKPMCIVNHTPLKESWWEPGARSATEGEGLSNHKPCCVYTVGCHGTQLSRLDALARCFAS